MIDEMYFVSNDTVIFCLEKKIGDFKKNNNFEEIEIKNYLLI